ncbi:MAG: hypothetical protein DHS20C16_25420 [Phycisphaerae bacterium]|nr:MAG: hypothetical protein DHS20C16_25420 [Phycisphaerae bacterium]
MNRELRHAALVLFLIVAPGYCAAEEFVQTGKYFRVVSHFDDDQIASEALKTAEKVWPVATKLLAVSDQPPEKLRDIHLFRTADDYQKAEFELTGGKFKDNFAFSHWGTQTAYIAIQPECSDDTLSQIGLPAMTRRLIAHEAAHLVRYANFPNFESHPNWLGTGAGVWIADKVMIDNGWSQGSEDDPETSTMIVHATELLKDSTRPSVNDIFNDDLNQVHWRKRYALRWLLFRLLVDSTDESEFRSIMKKARQLGGSSDYTTRLNAIIQKSLGPERMKKLDSEYRAYLASLKPKWDEVFTSLETAGPEWTQIAFSDVNALAWNTAPNEKDSYVITGEFKILPGWKRQLNLLLRRNADGFVSMAFVAGGSVTVFEYGSAKNTWDRLGSVRVESLAVDRWVPFEVKISKDTMQIKLDRKSVLSIPLDGKSMRGPWGLGAQSGSAGMWRNIKLQ